MGQPRYQLKRWRENRKLSLRAAAEGMGIGHNTLHRAERGEDLNLGTAKLIADFYGVLVTDLFSDEREAA